VRIGLISDTHGLLRPQVFDHFTDLEHILHAGDIGDPDILTALEAIAPVSAVFGNTDDTAIRAAVPERVEIDLAGRHIVLIHGHQVGAPTPIRLAAACPGADIVVFGHTHRPRDASFGSQRFLNPGGAGAPRFGLRPTIAILEIHESDETFELVEL
jgi:uncharacterized protein